ncbi:MAG: hypothetical protein WAN27_01575, partial [Xanthobacteraceae bacterium]
MSPAIAAARNAGPPIAGGNVSIESSGALIAAVFDGDGDGGADIEGIGRGGSEAVGSAAPGDGGCGAGVIFGAALGAIDCVVPGCVAGSVVAAGSAGEFCDGLPPALAPGTASCVVPGTGAISGVGPDVAAGDGSFLPEGCTDPLCGCAAFGFMSGGAAGAAGRCHGADASPAGRLSWKICKAICKQPTVTSTMPAATRSLRRRAALFSDISPLAPLRDRRRRRDLERISSSLA